jgi:ligand-binding sensor domain-containing protein/signal transduction histidine kinase
MPQTIARPDSPVRTDEPGRVDFARRFLTCFIVSISTITGAVPQPHIDHRTVRLPMVDGESIRFTRITTADGLSQTRVAQIVQDDQGFMWFGTEYGLNRYDGYKFKLFVHDAGRTNSLAGTFISALFKDRSGMLWIGSNRFLDKLDPTTEVFTHYQVEPDDPAGTIIHISQDRAGMLWLATGTGLDRFDPKTGQVRRYRRASGLSSNDVQWSVEDKSGTLWVGTSEGLDAFDWKTERVTLHIPIEQAVRAAFYEDRAGTFWIYNASGNGLAALDKKTNKLVQYSFYPHDPPQGAYAGVNSMLEDRQGNLWIGSPGVGLLRFDRQKRSFVRYRHDPADANSLAEENVTTLFKDREGNIWIGLQGHGPNHFSTEPAPFETFRSGLGSAKGLSVDLVNAIYADRDGILWIGNDDGLNGIDRKSGRVEQWTAGLSEKPVVISIIEDPQGYLWAGTWGNGLIRFDRGTGAFKIFRHVEGDPSSLSSNLIHRLFIDHAGSLWVGTNDGLNRFDRQTGRFTVFKADWNSRLSQAYVSIAEDATRGVLWLGTHYSGLHRLDVATGQLKIYRSNPGNPRALGDDLVPTVHVSAAGEVWVGTQNGLDKLDPAAGTFTAYTEKDGLSGNAVSCILEDRHGALWISTNRGLSRFDPRNKTFSNYSVADGLPGNDLTGWASCFESPNGEMFFAGFSGGVAFYPDRLDRNSYAPPVALTEFRLAGIPVEVGGRSPLKKSISYTTRLTLSHEQNIFSLAFSALSFRNPANNRYRYKLEGLENNWHEVGSDERLATYTTLPAGAYTFRLQGATSRGVWSEPGVKLEIEILPPMWKTAWFQTVCGALILTLAWALYRVRLHQIARQFNLRLEERVGERTRIARELHDTLLQSFQGLMLRFQVAHDELPGRPAEARKTLENALDHAAQAITEGRDAVQGLRSSTVETNDLAGAIGALGEELAGDETNSRRVESFVDVEGKPRVVHPILRDEIYRIGGEALRNAFRHAQARRIEVTVAYGEHQFRLRVRDDGRGIAPEVLEKQGRAGHWGLAGMRERAELIGGQLEIWSQQQSGTQVELSIPASLAYGTSPARRSRWFAKRAGTNS